MNQVVAAALSAVMIVSVLGVSGGAALGGIQEDVIQDQSPDALQQHADTVEQADADETNNTTSTGDSAQITPGEKLSGVVAVGAAEFKGELDGRALGHALANASTDEERAQIIAEHLNRTEDRLAELEQQRNEFENRTNRSDMTRGSHQARMATMFAETRSMERRLELVNATAADIPNETLEAHGVNESQIRTLQQNASDLGGPGAAESAHEIAGQNAGDRPGPGQGHPHGPPGDRGPGGNHGPTDDDGESGQDGDHGPGEDGDRGHGHDDDRDRGPPGDN